MSMLREKKKKENENACIDLSKGSGPWDMDCDDAEMFTSKMHDPCARSRCLQKRTTQKHLTEGTGVGPAKHPLKVKSEIFFTTLEC